METFSVCPTGRPPYFEGAHWHRHTGSHFKGNSEDLLCHHLQARGQHQRRGLDDLQAWQESQGRLRHKQPCCCHWSACRVVRVTGGSLHASTCTHMEAIERNMRHAAGVDHKPKIEPVSAITAFPLLLSWLHLRVYDRARISTRLQAMPYIIESNCI